jgi:hypothetical protein
MKIDFCIYYKVGDDNYRVKKTAGSLMAADELITSNENQGNPLYDLIALRQSELAINSTVIQNFPQNMFDRTGTV